MNVHWTDNAIADLELIRTSIARSSDRYALGVVRRIFDRTAVLSDQPRIGPMVPEFEIDTIRDVILFPLLRPER